MHDILHLAAGFLFGTGADASLAFIGTTAALIGLGGAIAGGVAGAAGNNSSKSDTSGMNLAPASDLENKASGTVSSSLDEYLKLAGAGANSTDVSNSLTASRSLSDLLGQYAQSGGLPDSNDIASGNSLAANLFQARRESLNQDFVNQNTEAERLAARLGRPVNDPVIQAKLRMGQVNANASLAAEQGDTATQIAMGLPGQRLNYSGQQVSLLDSLASQAFKNRAAILEAGSSIMNNERNFRTTTAQKYGTSTVNQGGGLGGAISGALGGIGTGLKIGNAFGMDVGGGNASAGTGYGALDGISAGMFGVNSFAQQPSGVASRGIGNRGTSLQPFDFFSNYPLQGGLYSK